MAPLTRLLVGAVALLASTGCYTAKETRGPNEAIAIYQRSTRKDLPPKFHGLPSAQGSHAKVDIPETPGAPLTVDVAIALAKKNSARLGAIESRIAVADAAIEVAGQRKNPEILATNVRLARSIDLGEDPRLVPRLRFAPERPGEIGAREAEARAASRAARAEARSEELAVEAEIRWLFDDILLLDAEISASESVATTRRKLAEQTHEQIANATAVAVDARLADLYAIQADVDVAERRSRRALLVADLLDRLGRGAQGEMRLEGDPTAWPPPALPSETALVEAALRASPRVAGAAAHIDEATARTDLERTRRWPWLRFIEVGYEVERATTNVPLWTVGAAVELPVFSANRGGIHRAEASKAAARQELEAEVERIVREVRSRLREATAAAALVTQFRSAARPALDEATAASARALESGSINVLRALNVDERKSHVEIQLFKLVRQYRASVDALRRAVGGPIPAP